MKNKANRSALLMMVGTFFWGTTFVAQRTAAQYIGAFTFGTFRSLLAVVLLFPVIRWMRKKGYIQGTCDRRVALRGGLFCGIMLFLATTSQQIGMAYVEASKAGFIGALYIVIVPILRFFQGKHTKPSLWICVLLAVGGMYLMSVTAQFTVASGDLIILLSALFFALQILAVDRFVDRVEPLMLCALQFLVTGLLSLPVEVFIEQPTGEAILSAALPILYTTVFSSCIAYSCQIIAQQDLEPTKASLMMCMESVFALLAGFVVLGEQFTLREGLGALCIFLAIVISTLVTRESGKQLVE